MSQSLPATRAGPPYALPATERIRRLLGIALLACLTRLLVRIMRPGRLARGLSKRASLARGVPSMLAAQPVASARRVKVTCASCGRVAAYVDEDPAGLCFRGPDLRLVVRSGNITRRHLQSLACSEHGRLKATWKAVLPAAVAARDGRVRKLQLWPVGPAS